MPPFTFDFASLFAIKDPEKRKTAAATQYQEAFDAANAANELRFQQGLEGFANLLSGSEMAIRGQGAQSRKDIEESARISKGQAQQRAVSSGLSAGTLLPSQFQGIEERKGESLARLNEAMSRQRLEVLNPLEQERIGFIERREDTPPDMATFLSLIENINEEIVGSQENLAGLQAAMGEWEALTKEAYSLWRSRLTWSDKSLEDTVNELAKQRGLSKPNPANFGFTGAVGTGITQYF